MALAADPAIAGDGARESSRLCPACGCRNAPWRRLCAQCEEDLPDPVAKERAASRALPPPLRPRLQLAGPPDARAQAAIAAARADRVLAIRIGSPPHTSAVGSAAAPPRGEAATMDPAPRAGAADRTRGGLIAGLLAITLASLAFAAYVVIERPARIVEAPAPEAPATPPAAPPAPVAIPAPRAESSTPAQRPPRRAAARHVRRHARRHVGHSAHRHPPRRRHYVAAPRHPFLCGVLGLGC
jgi:hypothetical protein